MNISVIIPVFHEGESICATVEGLLADGAFQVIVVDGDPAQSTLRHLEGISCTRMTAGPGRAVQMNAGARGATGDGLLFLHADTTLPQGWAEAVRAILGRGYTRCGAFELGFDASGCFARLTAQWATMRSRLDRRPYGDQAQFFTADFFRSLAGYAPIPLMEDVEIMARAARSGWPAAIVPMRVITSARRYEREGWLRRGAKNFWLRFRYAFGADPAILGGHYPPYVPNKGDAVMRQCVLFFLKWPEAGQVKTRLAREIGDDMALRFARAMAEDAIDAIDARAGGDLWICFAPQERVRDMRDWLGTSRRYLPQQGENLGERMMDAFSQMLGRGYDQVVLIGSDIPSIQAQDIDQALEWLLEPGTAVLGPATDGGYWLIGVNGSSFTQAAFSHISWSGPKVLETTVARLEHAGKRVRFLARRTDIDTLSDLRSVIKRGERVGPRTGQLAAEVVNRD